MAFWSFLLLIFMVTACQKPVKQIEKNGEIIKVGVIVSLSGKDALMGTKAFEGLQAALIEHPLTDEGAEIVLVIRDDQSDPKRAAALVEQLAEAHQVKALVALSTSDLVLSMKPVIERLRVPTVVAIASHEQITPMSSYISRVCMDNVQQSRVAAYFIHDELLYDKSAIYYTPSSVYSKSLSTLFQDEYEQIGGEVILKLRSNISKTALTMSLRRLREEGVEALFTSVKAEGAVALSRALHDLRWDVTVIGSDGLLGSLHTQGLDESMLDGMYLLEEYADERQDSLERRRLRASERETGIRLNTLGYHAYESHLLLMQALSRCSDTCTADELNAHLRDSEPFDGIDDRISTEEGAVQRPIFIDQVEDSKMIMHLKVY